MFSIQLQVKEVESETLQTRINELVSELDLDILLHPVALCVLLLELLFVHEHIALFLEWWIFFFIGEMMFYGNELIKIVFIEFSASIFQFEA